MTKLSLKWKAVLNSFEKAFASGGCFFSYTLSSLADASFRLFLAGDVKDLIGAEGDFGRPCIDIEVESNMV
jgi:hypothetical protein